MTIHSYATERFKALYKCDECGREGFWHSGDWSWYGSWSMIETIPDDVPTLCSENCREKFEFKLEVGEVEVPTVKCRGPNSYKVIGERRGY